MKHHAIKKYCHKRHGVLLPSLTFFIGVTLGFLIAPMKNGIGNNSGNINNHYYGKEEPIDDLN